MATEFDWEMAENPTKDMLFPKALLSHGGKSSKGNLKILLGHSSSLFFSDVFRCFRETAVRKEFVSYMENLLASTGWQEDEEEDAKERPKVS